MRRFESALGRASGEPKSSRHAATRTGWPGISFGRRGCLAGQFEQLIDTEGEHAEQQVRSSVSMTRFQEREFFRNGTLRSPVLRRRLGAQVHQRNGGLGIVHTGAGQQRTDRDLSVGDIQMQLIAAPIPEMAFTALLHSDAAFLR